LNVRHYAGGPETTFCLHCIALHCTLKADRISFSFYFSAPENAFFLFLGVLFFGRKKKHPHFRFLFFGTKMAVKKKVSTLAEPMHGGQNSESPAVEYSRCLHRYPQA